MTTSHSESNTIRLALEQRPVQWMDGDACMVGKRMLDDEGDPIIVSTCRDHYLIRLAQPIADVLVPCNEPTLCPYPSSPIPEPTNTGRRPG